MTDFFYDGQIRRYIIQFIRLLSNYQVKSGDDTLIQVPVIYGDSSHQVATIIAKNSENNLPSAPQISCYITGMIYDRDNIQNPTHVDKLSVKERFYDKDTQQYTGSPGESYIVERAMPTPYKLTINADLWTTNTEQKLQLIEQICYMFNPTLEIQTNNNLLDWTSITAAELTDFNWSSRVVPTGSEISIDIMTMTFEIKIHIAPPANIKRLGVIEKVVMGIFDGQSDLSDSVLNETQLMGQRQYYTPLNYGVLLLNGQLQILKVNEPITGQPDNQVDFDHIEEKYGTAVSWPQVIGQYGYLTNGISQIKLLQYFNSNDLNQVYDEVVGTVSYNVHDDTILDFIVDADTIPTNDLIAINAVINPIKNGPNAGLTPAINGQRYIILDDIGSPDNIGSQALAWPGVIANRNDIIEFNGTNWIVSFDSLNETGIHYIINLKTGIQYKWTGNSWIKSYEGRYKTGLWSILLNPR